MTGTESLTEVKIPAVERYRSLTLSFRTGFTVLDEARGRRPKEPSGLDLPKAERVVRRRGERDQLAVIGAELDG